MKGFAFKNLNFVGTIGIDKEIGRVGLFAAKVEFAGGLIEILCMNFAIIVNNLQ